MITLCSVFLEKTKEYQKIFLESLVKTKVISEVLICCADKPADFREEWTEREIKFIKFGPSEEYKYKPISKEGPSLQHGLGLHACISAASNEYIFCSDNDLFFYDAVDEIYYELMNKYGLDYIGCARHGAANNCCYGYFPYVHNAMMKKSHLPDADFMRGYFTRDKVEKESYQPPNKTYDGMFLYPMRIEAYDNYFPYPDRELDTSAYLYVWAKQQNWRWLSFITSDRFNYSTKYYRNSDNFKVDKIPLQKLIYHQGEAAWKYPEGLDDFRDSYELLKQENSQCQ